MFRADLHTHSTASDGELTPAALVFRAAQLGLSHLSITDHDTVAGLSVARCEASALGITLIDGIEISTEVEVGELHILGYGINRTNPELLSALDRFRLSSVERLTRMLALLRDIGIALPESIIVPSALGVSVGRPHIARALVASGDATSIGDAFDRFLGEGKPAFVHKRRINPVDAVHLIRQGDGLPVLAHPLGVGDLGSWLPALKDAGLRGLECYYGEYKQPDRDGLAQFADSHGLLATGGSDFHGENFRDGRDLGCVDIPQHRLQRFLASVER